MKEERRLRASVGLTVLSRLQIPEPQDSVMLTFLRCCYNVSKTRQQNSKMDSLTAMEAKCLKSEYCQDHIPSARPRTGSFLYFPASSIGSIRKPSSIPWIIDAFFWPLPFLVFGPVPVSFLMVTSTLLTLLHLKQSIRNDLTSK